MYEYTTNERKCNKFHKHLFKWCHDHPLIQQKSFPMVYISPWLICTCLFYNDLNVVILCDLEWWCLSDFLWCLWGVWNCPFFSYRDSKLSAIIEWSRMTVAVMPLFFFIRINRSMFFQHFSLNYSCRKQHLSRLNKMYVGNKVTTWSYPRATIGLYTIGLIGTMMTYSFFSSPPPEWSIFVKHQELIPMVYFSKLFETKEVVFKCDFLEFSIDF